MDYEKLYKEALSRARQFSEHPLQEDSDSIVEYIFPELKGSDDEEVRKAMIDFFKHEREEGVTVLHYGVNIERMIAWLEKQVKLVLDWLKCLKDRVQPQPKQEWSESDKEEFQIAIDTLVEAGQHDSAHWLKSLKQRIGG